MRALEIGTKVRIKENLVEDGIYKHHTGGTNVFVDKMEHYKGKVFNIVEDNFNGYKLNGSIYNFTDEMLEVVEYPNGLKYREGDYLLNLESLDLVKVVRAVNEKRYYNYALEYVNPDTDVNIPNPMINGKYLCGSSTIENEHYYKLVPEPNYKVGQKVTLEVDELNAKLDEYQKELDEIYKKQSDLLVEERKLLDRENEINKILSAIQTTIDEFQEQ